MRKLQLLMDEMIARGILIGPGHYVLGDGYGNPDKHCRLFVDWQKFNLALDLYAECVEHLAGKLSHLQPELILTPDEESLPTARMLAKVISVNSYGPPVPCHSYNELFVPEKPRTLTLIHDDFVNRGLQVKTLLAGLNREHFQPLAISSLFTRIAEKEMENLAVYCAVEQTLVATPVNECELCRAGVPINTDCGKGALFLERQQAIAAAPNTMPSNEKATTR